MLKSIFSGFLGIVFGLLFALLLAILFILLSSVKVMYPESGNLQCYGFYADSSYVRTSDRNPFTSPNGSNKDTLVLTSIQGRWLKFSNGEMLELHSPELDAYQWEFLNK